MKMPVSKKNLKLIAFDLDGTLAESKSRLTPEMASLLTQLLDEMHVAIVSGAAFQQFEKQFLSTFTPRNDHAGRVHILSTNGARLYEYSDTWNTLHTSTLTPDEKKKIFQAFDEALSETGFAYPETIYGILIEDRDSQITFSAFGSEAPLTLKEGWYPDHAKRARIALALRARLPEFSVRIGGSTSIDITKQGVDKASGLLRLMSHLNIAPHELLYIGDALFEGGNDASVHRLGSHTRETSGPEETKHIINTILSEE